MLSICARDTASLISLARVIASDSLSRDGTFFTMFVEKQAPSLGDMLLVCILFDEIVKRRGRVYMQNESCCRSKQ